MKGALRKLKISLIHPIQTQLYPEKQDIIQATFGQFCNLILLGLLTVSVLANLEKLGNCRAPLILIAMYT
jgi:hypothetical protein